MLGQRLYRVTFAAAAIYNVAFGLWAGLAPHLFFEWLGLDAPRYPSIWACVGMIVGLYGLLYGYAAWRPDRGRPIIAIGLLGKLLGPVGMAIAVAGGELPARALTLNVFNDLIWWLPFGLFLLEGTWLGERVRAGAPWICAVLHAVGLVALVLFLRGGGEAEPDATARAAYVLDNAASWRFGWAIWMASAMSLVGFYAWWGARLESIGWATAGVMAAALGMVCDLTGESLFVGWLTDPGARFESLQRTGTLLTAGAANGLYTLGGVLLTMHTRGLPGWVAGAIWATWLAGFGMTLSALLDHAAGMMASTIVLFPLLLIWVSWMGARWRDG